MSKSKWWLRIKPKLHTWLYRVSNGRLGNGWGRDSVALIYSNGAKTGKLRINPVAYERYNNGYVVVAANMASKNKPGWLYNILSGQPTAIQIGARKVSANARVASGALREELWRAWAQKHPSYKEYAETLNRDLPVVIFEPKETDKL